MCHHQPNRRQEPHQSRDHPRLRSWRLLESWPRLPAIAGSALTSLDGPLKALTKTVVETALDEEMSDHPGYDKHAVEGRDRERTCWNGSQHDHYRGRDEMQIEVPRNRDGTLAPQAVKKRQRRLSDLDAVVIFAVRERGSRAVRSWRSSRTSTAPHSKIIIETTPIVPGTSVKTIALRLCKGSPLGVGQGSRHSHKGVVPQRATRRMSSVGARNGGSSRATSSS